MVRALVLLLFWLASTEAIAQGLVNFFNSPATLVNTNIYPGYGTPVSLSWTPGSFYFGLLTAPEGTRDPRLFSFSGVYATNVAAPGRFTGGSSVPVPGWSPGSSQSFLVAAWSADLGHDWNQSWMYNYPPGLWALSSIGSGTAGGWDNGPLPPLNLFGGSTGIQIGLSFEVIPEPAAAILGLLATAALTLRRPLGFDRIVPSQAWKAGKIRIC